MPVEVLHRTVQLTLLGKRHDTPLIVTGLLQRYFLSPRGGGSLQQHIEVGGSVVFSTCMRYGL